MAMTGAVDQATLDALREGVAGVLAEQSNSTHLHAFIDGKTTLDRDLWSQAAALGWLGVGIPEQYGGLGMGAQGLAILHGELGRQAAPGPYVATLSAAQTIVECGDETTRQAWLPRLAVGEISAAVPANLSVAPLRRIGAGLAGTLRCLGNADATILLVPTEDGWAIVELSAAMAATVSVWDRTRQIIDVCLDGIRPVTTLTNPALVKRTLVRSMALAVAADGAAGARSITERTIDYMKTRQQFGQPIAGFQALKHRAADLATRLAVMDQLVAHAIERIVLAAADADIWAALAKSEVTETAVFVTTDCVQLHGGVGFTWDFDPHIFLKRARLNEILITSNLALRDQAAAELAALTSAGHSALEIAL
jgi:alkylation response protein AidB-like acyl-CoA dehydrogenase